MRDSHLSGKAFRYNGNLPSSASKFHLQSSLTEVQYRLLYLTSHNFLFLGGKPCWSDGLLIFHIHRFRHAETWWMRVLPGMNASMCSGVHTHIRKWARPARQAYAHNPVAQGGHVCLSIFSTLHSPQWMCPLHPMCRMCSTPRSAKVQQRLCIRNTYFVLAIDRHWVD